jgi:hypothetical protein
MWVHRSNYVYTACRRDLCTTQSTTPPYSLPAPGGSLPRLPEAGCHVAAMMCMPQHDTSQYKHSTGIPVECLYWLVSYVCQPCCWLQPQVYSRQHFPWGVHPCDRCNVPQKHGCKRETNIHRTDTACTKHVQSYTAAAATGAVDVNPFILSDSITKHRWLMLEPVAQASQGALWPVRNHPTNSTLPNVTRPSAHAYSITWQDAAHKLPCKPPPVTFLHITTCHPPKP